MAQNVIPLFTDTKKMSEANAVADKNRQKMNEVFVPQPVVRTQNRTS